MWSGFAKYLVWNTHLGEVSAVFSDRLVHSEVAHSMGITKQVIGAGFVRFESNPQDPDIAVRCTGKSVSLGKESRRELDAAVIHRDLIKPSI